MDSVWLGINENLAQMHHDAIMHLCVCVCIKCLRRAAINYKLVQFGHVLRPLSSLFN